MKKTKVGTKEHEALKWREAIKVLNRIVNSKIAPSDIHGVGVFATRDIKKGEQLGLNAIPHMFDVPYKLFDKLNKGVRQTLLEHFPMKTVEHKQDEESKKKYGEAGTFWYPVNNIQAYLNHSDKPNYDNQTDKALRDIKKGEEITEDYRKIPGYENIYDFIK